MNESNVTDQLKSPEPKLMRRKKGLGGCQTGLKLALTNVHEERERSEMMDGLMDCDQDFEPDYDE